MLGSTAPTSLSSHLKCDHKESKLSLTHPLSLPPDNPQDHFPLRDHLRLELETNLREPFTIKEKAPTRAFSRLKVSSSALTFKIREIAVAEVSQGWL